MDFMQSFFSFPLAITAVPFCFLFLLMLLSVFTGVVDDLPFLNFDTDVDVDADAVSAGTWLPIGITKVPLTISLTTVTFVATVLMYYIDHFVLSTFDAVLYVGLSLAALIASLLASLYIAAFLLKPLSPLFDQKKAFAVVDYVGMNARIRSNRVSGAFGEAVVTQGGLENLLDVYSESEEPISYGDEVLIVSHNPELQRYLVIKK